MAEKPTADGRAETGPLAKPGGLRGIRSLSGLVVDRSHLATLRRVGGWRPAFGGRGLGANPAGADGGGIPWWVWEGVSCLISLVAHMVILLVLGLCVVQPDLPSQLAELDIVPTMRDEQRIERMLNDRIPDLELDERDVPEQLVDMGPVSGEQDFSLFDDMDAAAVQVDLSDFGELRVPDNDLLKMAGAFQGSALQGRGAGDRAALVRSGGGTPGSEKAVALALDWLQRHQNSNGSWSLDHRRGPCQGRCSDPGVNAPSLNAATALALLPFLGAGQTHKEGEYTKTVGAGLYFLVRSMQVSGRQGSLHEPLGTMYSHGIASIALCEAYAMTQDRALAGPGQMALNFIVSAQDPVGGGWRYEPRMPGDTSVLGWQLMALKSGHMAYLEVPATTIKKASRFLDSVQQDGGAFYGYVAPGQRKAFGTTAVGLLCRMYLGWKRDNEALKRGIDWVAKHGPEADDLYGNYYAMQAMFQYTGGKGPTWEKWNSALRDQLIHSQAKDDHAAGSWFLPSGHSNEAGGRLYCTSMAAMILEVYYRHLPIYSQEATEVDFPF